MAKSIHHGLAKPDDPIYSSGPVIGGKRFFNNSKVDKPASPPKVSPKKRAPSNEGGSE